MCTIACVPMMRMKKAESTRDSYDGEKNCDGMGWIVLRAKGGANGNEKNG